MKPHRPVCYVDLIIQGVPWTRFHAFFYSIYFVKVFSPSLLASESKGEMCRDQSVITSMD